MPDFRLLSLVRVAAVTLLFVVAACKDGTAPPVPASIAATDTNSPTATAGILVAMGPTFVVKDAAGNILGGIPVTIVVTSGGGTLTGAPTQTLGGVPTPIGMFTPGKTVGANTITITAGNLPPIVLTIIGTAGAPASLIIISGADQSALAGTAVAAPIVVQVRDQFDNPVPNTPVSFAVIAGGGSVSQTTVNSDSNGNATAPAWQLGRVAFPQILRAAVGSVSISVNATVQTEYSIDIRFNGPALSPEASSAFVEAVARIRAGLIGDVPDITITQVLDLTPCGIAGVSLNPGEVIDDLIIYATVSPIDGPGKVLASAGACFIRGAPGRQSLIGSMRFDADDIGGLVASGRLNDVILHEMLHVVGISAGFFNLKGLIAGRGTEETRFTGALGIGACIESGGAAVCPTGVPLENTGGPGTADSHWRESIFDSELMTGFVEPAGKANEFSIITLQALADFGYVVNSAAADPYSVPAPTAGSVLGSKLSAEDSPGWEVLQEPRFEITQGGVVRTLVAPLAAERNQ